MEEWTQEDWDRINEEAALTDELIRLELYLFKDTMGMDYFEFLMLGGHVGYGNLNLEQLKEKRDELLKKFAAMKDFEKRAPEFLERLKKKIKEQENEDK